MTNYRRYDEIFYDMEQALEKMAEFPKYRGFGGREDFQGYIGGLTCEQINQYDPRRARVMGEDAELIFNTHQRVKACRGRSADDKTAAVEFAIQYITKIADELDKNGFIEAANILDEALQKFATLHDCKDCEQ